MTKKHFIKFAAEIKAYASIAGYKNQAKSMAEMVIRVASADNPNFDKGRFLTACGL